jgi:hypothetical protein
MIDIANVIPDSVPEIRGNHGPATKAAERIAGYANRAAALLKAAESVELGAYERAGLLREGLRLLRTAVRHAQCAERDLNIAYGPREDS